MRQILLNSAKNNENVNVENSVFTELSTKHKLLPNEHVEGVVNQFEVYLNERDKCNNYKLFFTLHPYMTNVLFNTFTEVVVHNDKKHFFITDNGSSYLTDNGDWKKALNKSEINRRQCIRDTEYSHEKLGNFEYRCGVDIFNNHYLRTNGFFGIKKANGTDDKVTFNTIESYQTYSNGNIATYEKPLVSSNVMTNTKTIKLHLFNRQNIEDFKTSFISGIKEYNGWVGFYNKSYAPIKNKFGDEELVVNRCINNKDACEFIDFYPDRTLFSFLPKINDLYLQREEYNWAWYLTYPSNNVYTINGRQFNFFEKDKGLRVILHETNNKIKREYGRLIYFRTICKHNLDVDDIVKINYGKIDNNLSDDFSLRVQKIGNEVGKYKEYYFAVLYDDLALEIKEEYSDDESYYITLPESMYVTKIVNGIACKYYVREFSVISGMNSTMNRMAFSKTIYGDDVAQIIYNNNLDITKLKDNLGRDVSEVFLTVVKRNKGYNEYYKEDGKINYVEVDCSSCFGKVSSGFEFNIGDDELKYINDVADYNIHMIHNLEYVNGFEKSPLKLEEEVRNNAFYGDFVEFSPSTMEETVLEDVYHRFNTVQREMAFSNGMKFKYDELVNDDFDLNENNKENVFRIEELPTDNDTWHYNIFPEGYYYKPHYRVKLKEYSSVVSFDSDIIIDGTYKGSKQDFTNYHYIKINKKYALLPEDSIIFYYKDGRYETYNVDTSSNADEIVFFAPNLTNNNKKPVKMFIKNPLIPSYAYYLGDGTGRYVWRKLLNESELSSDSDIYNRTFGNGALYMNTNINFYLKRQDPNGIYGLQYSKGKGGEFEITDMIVTGVNTVIENVDYKTNESTEVCEI